MRWRSRKESRSDALGDITNLELSECPVSNAHRTSRCAAHEAETGQEPTVGTKLSAIAGPTFGTSQLRINKSGKRLTESLVPELVPPITHSLSVQPEL